MNNKLTEKYLLDINACEESISFAKRNNLIGAPLSLLKDVKGDYETYIYSLRNAPKLEYDSKGNCIRYKDSDGDSWTRGYDSKGNCIRHEDPSGYSWTREFTHHKSGSLKSVSRDGKIILEIPEWR